MTIKFEIEHHNVVNAEDLREGDLFKFFPLDSLQSIYMLVNSCIYVRLSDREIPNYVYVNMKTNSLHGNIANFKCIRLGKLILKNDEYKDIIP